MANEASVLEHIGGLEVWIKRKHVKNISLYIKPPDGRIEVTAPARCPMRKIEEFVLSKRGWIEKKQLEIRGSIYSHTENAKDEEVEEWRELVGAVAPLLIEKWEPVLGVKCRKLVFRNMRSRWGSCQPETGRICINVRLALYPPDCLEYVVVHELCHLLVSGHGKDFHGLMDRCLPSWRRSRAKLKE